jgi:hypothetical protein
VQENPSHLPPKRWDGENFRPTYPGGTDFWLVMINAAFLLYFNILKVTVGWSGATVPVAGYSPLALNLQTQAFRPSDRAIHCPSATLKP